ncbi:PREDICTED: uncharacterized protein LOC104787519 [Camelina sativa]|uniref:Uncharacterized protein LOC104787519 n=1 Tax=Camelina sativa TaxID=90675 RepID=A0ABM0Z7A4_CAMSA|nr:PREDICTED: uncharacterized protein LOC104787519 [Camelina sativa]
MNHFAVQPNTFAAGGDLRSSVSVVERDQPPSFAQNHVVLGSVTTIIIILLDLSAATSGLGGSFKTTQPNHSPQGPSGLKNSRLNSALLSVTKVTEVAGMQLSVYAAVCLSIF